MERQNQMGHNRILISFLNKVKYFLLVYFYIVVVDYGMKPRESTPYYCMLLLLGMTVSFWGQQKIKHLLPFLLYQAAVACGCTMVGRNKEERVLFFLFGVLQFCIALGETLGEQKRVVLNSTSMLLLLGIPGLLYGYMENYDLLYETFVWVAVAFLWVHLWNAHLANRQRFFVEYTPNADSMEKGKILTDGNRVIGNVLGVAAVGLFFGTQMGEGGWLDSVLKRLYRALRWFLSLFTHGEVEEYVPEAVETPAATAGEIVGEEMLKQNEILSRILEILGAIFLFALKVLSVLLVLALLGFFVYSVWKSFYRRQPEQEKEYEEVEKIREKVPEKEKYKRKWVLFGNANERVRKLFQRKIEKTERMGEHSKRTKTSTELVNVVAEEAKDTVEQMLPLYQKARYSKENISKEELENYKRW